MQHIQAHAMSVMSGLVVGLTRGANSSTSRSRRRFLICSGHRLQRCGDAMTKDAKKACQHLQASVIRRAVFVGLQPSRTVWRGLCSVKDCDPKTIGYPRRILSCASCSSTNAPARNTERRSPLSKCQMPHLDTIDCDLSPTCLFAGTDALLRLSPREPHHPTTSAFSCPQNYFWQLPRGQRKSSSAFASRDARFFIVSLFNREHW